MRKIFLALCLAVCSAQARGANIPMEETQRLKQAFLAGNFSADADHAIDSMIATGTRLLRAKGMADKADQISSDWNYKYKGFLNPGGMWAVGDHRPLEWLLSVWQILDAALGSDAMILFHLDDLKELAYTIPVVIYCEDNVDATEYELHFTVFSGAVTFWVVFAGCEIALINSPFALICSSAGDVCESLMANFIAPQISDAVWAKACKH